MNEVNEKHIVAISKFSDEELLDFMNKNAISLKIDEARSLTKKFGRDPTLTELHIFNTEWSEHCSYKSSRHWLKLLPTDGPSVIQGPAEDAGILKLTTDKNGVEWGLVIGHESHNHPSQVVPYEGAATGIGGIVRDIECMGAEVVATADPLRFGSYKNENKNRTKYIASSVVDGIAGYSNPLGIPNIAGDIYFNESFDENCLVNVACLGVIKKEEIIHSYVPKSAEGYDLIVVGKATDNSGFGGAAFASLILDSDDDEFNKGAVQVPDPFLKNVLLRSTQKVFDVARKEGVELGFKDMGAGGIMCVSSELCQSGGFGAKIDINKIHVSMNNLPPYVIACGETQERFCWASPKEFTQTILDIYNKEFELPKVAEGAQASVVGVVTKEKQYVMTHNEEVVCNCPIDEVTEGIRYEREYKEPPKTIGDDGVVEEPTDYNQTLKQVLANPNIASKESVYEHYDTEVKGNAVIRPGEADAGVIAPIRGESVGVALSVDSNPRFNRLNPHLGGEHSVLEAIRNVAAVGATAQGMTDCLCYGNPENPEHFWQFVEGVKGISKAANELKWKGDKKSPVPFVSGNVSFYNQAANGKTVDPSPIIACAGVIEDYSKAITMDLKENGSTLFMIGERKDELGASAYLENFGKLGKVLPSIDYEKERNMIYFVIDAIDKRLVKSCHDISDGGMITTVSEMAILGKKGAIINTDTDLRLDKYLFTENSGFVLEVSEESVEEVMNLSKENNLDLIKIGKVEGNSIKVNDKIDIGVDEIETVWRNAFSEVLK